MKNSLEHLLKHIAAFERSELDTILDCFKPKSVKKNTLLLSAGNICREFYYIHTGCLRTAFIDAKGNEMTRLVLTDCNIGTALASFISQKPSVEFIEVLEDTELLAVSHHSFYQLNREYRCWNFFYQRMLEMAYSYQNRRIEQLVTLSAQQRYHQVLNDQPLLIQKLSNKLLASYLDIREETLSRLKSV